MIFHEGINVNLDRTKGTVRNKIILHKFFYIYNPNMDWRFLRDTLYSCDYFSIVLLHELS